MTAIVFALIEIGPNLTQAITIVAICFMFAVLYWAITR